MGPRPNDSSQEKNLKTPKTLYVMATIKKTSAALLKGTLVAGALAFATPSNAASLFEFNTLGSAAAHRTSLLNLLGEAGCGADKKEAGKTGEHKCGESKTGEHKCGESKTGEHKCGEGKTAEAKCGEGKCGSKVKNSKKDAKKAPAKAPKSKM